MNFKDSIATIDVQGVEPLATDVPRFHWYHGVKQAKTAGHFFIRASAAPAEPTNPPWIAFTNAYDDEGYKAEALKIAVIAKREVWFIPGENGAPPVYLTGYQAGAKNNIEVLAFVEGFGTEPMVLSMSGKFKAGALKTILKQYAQGLLRQAATVAGKPLPAWTFWLPLGTQRDSKGSPIYEQTQGANGGAGAAVTPPILVGPLDMDALYVGAELMKEGEAIKAAYTSWEKESRVAGVIEGEIIAPKALPAPKNAPRPIESDEDLPF